MAANRTVRLCPICQKEVKKTDPDFPFCGERCRVIDLGKWASGEYVISSPVDDAVEAIGERDRDDEEGE